MAILYTSYNTYTNFKKSIKTRQKSLKICFYVDILEPYRSDLYKNFIFKVVFMKKRILAGITALIAAFCLMNCDDTPPRSQTVTY